MAGEAGDDGCLDFTSEKFEPKLALSSNNVSSVCSDVKVFNNIKRYAESLSQSTSFKSLNWFPEIFLEDGGRRRRFSPVDRSDERERLSQGQIKSVTIHEKIVQGKKADNAQSTTAEGKIVKPVEEDAKLFFSASKVKEPEQNVGEGKMLSKKGTYFHGKKVHPVVNSERKYSQSNLQVSMGLTQGMPTDGTLKKLQDEPCSIKLSTRAEKLRDLMNTEITMKEKDGKERRIRPNILQRMQASQQGPLSILYNCIEKGLRLKVWTRRYKGLRGVCVGYLIAYDKHMNLAMIDVDEVYTVEIRTLSVEEQKSIRRSKKKDKRNRYRLNRIRREMEMTTNEQEENDGENSLEESDATGSVMNVMKTQGTMKFGSASMEANARAVSAEQMLEQNLEENDSLTSSLECGMPKIADLKDKFEYESSSNPLFVGSKEKDTASCLPLNSPSVLGIKDTKIKGNVKSVDCLNLASNDLALGRNFASSINDEDMPVHDSSIIERRDIHIGMDNDRGRCGEAKIDDREMNNLKSKVDDKSRLQADKEPALQNAPAKAAKSCLTFSKYPKLKSFDLMSNKKTRCRFFCFYGNFKLYLFKPEQILNPTLERSYLNLMAVKRCRFARFGSALGQICKGKNVTESKFSQFHDQSGKLSTCQSIRRPEELLHAGDCEKQVRMAKGRQAGGEKGLVPDKLLSDYESLSALKEDGIKDALEKRHQICGHESFKTDASFGINPERSQNDSMGSHIIENAIKVESSNVSTMKNSGENKNESIREHGSTKMQPVKYQLIKLDCDTNKDQCDFDISSKLLENIGKEQCLKDPRIRKVFIEEQKVNYRTQDKSSRAEGSSRMLIDTSKSDNKVKSRSLSLSTKDITNANAAEECQYDEGAICNDVSKRLQSESMEVDESLGEPTHVSQGADVIPSINVSAMRRSSNDKRGSSSPSAKHIVDEKKHGRPKAEIARKKAECERNRTARIENLSDKTDTVPRPLNNPPFSGHVLRTRHVNQLFIRGDNIVLVALDQ